MLRTGVILADRYQLDEPIAAGGVGQVWRATDLILQRPVAIKLLRPEYADHYETLSRFRAEARHAGSIAHPGIAQVYDFGESSAEGPPYLVMELVDGPSLADVLATEPVTPAYALDVLAKAATGLAAAHEAGLVHRDIKPGNILLGRDGQVKITDFGIAHAVGSAPVTDPGLVMGTTQYLAPERIAGGSGTPAADLYSLGIVMHECLTGSPPYEGTPAEVMAGHLYVPLPPLPAGTPPEVEDLVARLTAKDPEQRITDANELAALAQRVHTSITGGPMPRQRQAPAISPAGGVAAPADLTNPAVAADYDGPARMPQTGDHQVPQTGDMMLDPSLTMRRTGEHPYAAELSYAEPSHGEPEVTAGPEDDTSVVGGFRVDAGFSTPDMGNPYEEDHAAAAPVSSSWDDGPAPEVPGTELALREPGDGHGTVALREPEIPEASVPEGVRETSVDLAAVSETSVDLAGLSQIQSDAGAGARTTSVDLVGADDPRTSHGASTDVFETEGAFTGGHAPLPLTTMREIPEVTDERPRGRRRAAIGIGVLLLAGGGLTGVAASGMLHAAPAADSHAKSPHQPLSAVQPNAGGQTTTPGKANGAKHGRHGAQYTAKHAKSSTAPAAPAASSAPQAQQSASTAPPASSTTPGGGSPSGSNSPKPQPSTPPSSKSCLLGVLCSG